LMEKCAPKKASVTWGQTSTNLSLLADVKKSTT
jgi:hypothetical protein